MLRVRVRVRHALPGTLCLSPARRFGTLHVPSNTYGVSNTLRVGLVINSCMYISEAFVPAHRQCRGLHHNLGEVWRV